MTSPRTGAPASRRLTPRSQIDARTRLGEVYVRTLMRAQLRLAIGVLLVVGLTLVSLPLLFRFVPSVNDATLLGMPLPWLVLAFAAYPFLVACGWFYVRRAERNDQAFTAVLSGGEVSEDSP